MTHAALEIRSLAKAYDGEPALADFSLTARAGRRVALLGPNGAGKTTGLRCVAGILAPDAGTIAVHGYPAGTTEAQRLISYIPEVPELYAGLTVAEHLRFIALAYRLREWQDRAASLLERFGLARRADELPRALSRGMRQKLSVTMGLLHDAQVVLMDEPFNGLDPRASFELRETISRLAEAGSAVVVSTHLLAGAEQFADEVFVIDRGRNVASGSLGELRRLAAAADDADLEAVFLALTPENRE